MIAFILDGGPKLTSCVINRLYNVVPSRWKLLPRELEEIGGSIIQVDENVVHQFLVLDTALMTSEPDMRKCASTRAVLAEIFSNCGNYLPPLSL